jgi:hypothetical protein
MASAKILNKSVYVQYANSSKFEAWIVEDIEASKAINQYKKWLSSPVPANRGIAFISLGGANAAEVVLDASQIASLTLYPYSAKAVVKAARKS